MHYILPVQESLRELYIIDVEHCSTILYPVEYAFRIYNGNRPHIPLYLCISYMQKNVHITQFINIRSIM